jgi:class 3 adenylate cyclase/energy-coupling factor transporter ATP-binding protein EcfA2
VDIAAWLRGLGLEQYEAAFRANAIDASVLPRLTAEDLKDLGVTLVGHRRRLLDAIAALGAEPAVADVPVRAAAERRQLTVMFCDLVGSTALAVRFDPEDLREIEGAYHRVVAETVGRFGGFVAKYMGDGVLIYFGYPRAHEEDAERAIRAGLAVVDGVARLDAPERLEVRIGVASGLVVVGDLIGEGAALERGVVGETPNLAARLQALAKPGTLVVADSTRRQIGALFDAEDLGLQPLTGFATPQRAWRVLGESGVLSRFEALRSEATPLVGRDEELELLLRRWQQAKAGEGRVVLISGEPGIGKSRLTAAITGAVEHDLPIRLRWFCSPHHQDSALYPVIVQLEHGAGLARQDPAEEKLEKLKSVLAPGVPNDNEFALLSELLSLPNAAAELNLSPQKKREKLFEALTSQLTALSRGRPVLATFEDAHWIDPTSREFLDLMVEQVRRLAVLLVITFRPEFQHGWGERPHVTMLALNRLGERETAALQSRVQQPSRAQVADLRHHTKPESSTNWSPERVRVERLSYRALLRRLAQAVAANPFTVRLVIRNPGHSRRARVLLSSARRAPRHRHHKSGEHHGKRTHVHVPSSGCIHRPAARRLALRRMVDLPLYILSSRSISIASIFRF